MWEMVEKCFHLQLVTVIVCRIEESRKLWNQKMFHYMEKFYRTKKYMLGRKSTFVKGLVN